MGAWLMAIDICHPKANWCPFLTVLVLTFIQLWGVRMDHTAIDVYTLLDAL